MASPRRWFDGLSRNVMAISLISLLNDASSEMIYPLLPLFLSRELGAGPAFLGLIEGVADSTSSLLTLVSGIWSDRAKDRTRLVFAGYALASLTRPLVAAARSPLPVLFIRFVDRLGKGLRSSPRDAILGESVDPSLRGKAFGFHRAMDNAGAVLGPLIASGLLFFFALKLRTVFWLAAIPGFAAAVLAAKFIREPDPGRAPVARAWSFEAPAPSLRPYLAVLFLFTLSQSTDAFILLRASELGVPAAQLPLIWVALHVVKSLSGMPFGMLSDKVGRRPVLLAGWAVYALAYAGFALAKTPLHAWGLFCVYGVFYGMTEGPSRALLADLARRDGKGAAFGWYHFVVGIAALPASVIFGLLWQSAGASAAFFLGAAVAVVSAVLLAVIPLPGGERIHVYAPRGA